MYILLKRAKFFHGPKGQRLSVGLSGEPAKVPNWVAGAPEFALGVADGSIIDLTPSPKNATVAKMFEEESNPSPDENTEQLGDTEEDSDSDGNEPPVPEGLGAGQPKKSSRKK